jgi:glycosyltransferase involved in cell wall biosynthesis
MNTTRHYVAPDELAQVYTDIRFETVDVNNEVKPLPTLLNFLFTTRPNHADRFRHLGFAEKLLEVLHSFRPEIVQVESVFLSGYLRLIKTVSPLTILRLHNIEFEIWRRLANESKGPKKWYLDNLATRICKYEHKAWAQYDLLLPITGTDAEVAGRYNENILTIPFGIDTSAITKTDDQGLLAYHIGAMDWMPNADAMRWFLNDIWPRIHKEMPAFTFYFAGRKMPDEFRQMHVPGAICAGEVPDADAFISNKKILVVPLRSGGGIRVKILEAMAAGKIVVSTAVGMQGINAVAGKHYIQANMPAEFADAMKWIYNNISDAQEMAQEARLLVQLEYDRGEQMRQLIDKIDNMLAENQL